MRVIFILSVLSYLAIPLKGWNLDENSAWVIILKEHREGVYLEKCHIIEGQTKELSDSAIINIVIPHGFGKFGYTVCLNERNLSYSISYKNGKISITSKDSIGSRITYPEVSPDDLSLYDTRLNITSGKGFKIVYEIQGYDKIAQGIGPVISFTENGESLQETDYSIVVENKLIEKKQEVAGRIPFEKVGGWIVVEATIQGNIKGRFILDSGFSGYAVISKEAISSVHAEKHVSYDSRGFNIGQKVTSAIDRMGTSNYLNNVKLFCFQIGDIVLDSIDAMVYSEFPDFLREHNIQGILGQNLISSTKGLRIENLDKRKGEIIFYDNLKPSNEKFKESISFHVMSNLIFLEGKIKEVPVNYIVDFGSTRSIIDQHLLKENNIFFEEKGIGEMVGISGKVVGTLQGKLHLMTIGESKFYNIDFLTVPRFFISNSLGLEDKGVLLGMDFFRRFSVLQFDFTNNVLSMK
ncbi:MAG: aspartyl protease family protein [Cyclobacteriaceae bacterium]|nr:aspartyl protease family protein [Cyclobacteriaceae bacterium]